MENRRDNILTSKSWIPLCRREKDFIYVDKETNQFYRVTESRFIGKTDWVVYIAALFGATIFRNVLSAFKVDLPVLHRIGVLVLLLSIPFLIARSQLKKWGKFIAVTRIVLSEQMREYVLNEAEKTQKGNEYLWVVLVVLFVVSSVIFVVHFDGMSVVLSLIFGYVLALLEPTLKLKARKDFMKQLQQKKS